MKTTYESNLRNKYTIMKQIIYYIVIIILLIALILQCRNNSHKQKQADNTHQYKNDSISYYRNIYNAEIASKTALKGNIKDLQDSTKQLNRLIKGYKKVIAAGNVQTVVKIDTIRIGFDVPVPCEFERSWSKFDKYYSINGQSNQNGIIIENIEIPNLLSFAIGDKKTGFFKTQYKVEATNSNPYIKITGLDAYTLDVPKKRFGISLVAGYGMSKDGLTPFVGAGLSYNLIQF